MQVETYDIKILLDLVQSSQKVAIIPSKALGADSFCAAVGLYRMLKDSDKEVSLVYQGKIPEGCEDLIKKDELTSNTFQRELLVSIDYSNTPAAKIHWT